jgi:hypothetical protein
MKPNYANKPIYPRLATKTIGGTIAGGCAVPPPLRYVA